ncbi:MAG: endospore germination permease [Bacillota bacterium]
MLEGGRVNNRQAALILPFLAVMPTAVLFVPAITAIFAKQNGWLSLLVVATVFGLLVALVAVKLGLRFPGQTVVEYAPEILGPYLGKLVGAGFVFWFIHLDAVIIREYSAFLMTAFMPETPQVVFAVFQALLAVIAVRGGLEVICRAGEWVFVVFILSLVIILGLVVHDADFTELLPVLENGVKPVIHGGLTPSAFRGEVVLMLMLLPYINQPQKTLKYLFASVILMGITLAQATVVATSEFGIMTESLTFPLFSLARFISVFGFIERLESLILIMWVAGVSVKVAVFYYVAALGAAQLFNLKDYRPVALPIGVILAAWSVSLFEDSREVVEWLIISFPPYAHTFQLLIPSLLLLVAVLRKKGGTENGG